MKLLDFFRNKKVNFYCARNIEITFPESNSNELDLFILTEKAIPICVFGLSEEQANGMSSMYDLTFVNENKLLHHMETVI